MPDADSSHGGPQEQLETEPWMNIPMVFGLIGLFGCPNILNDFRETYESRTKIGKVVFFVQYPFVLTLLVLMGATSVGLVLIGGLLALPSFAVVAYKRVVYKDEA